MKSSCNRRPPAELPSNQNGEESVEKGKKSITKLRKRCLYAAGVATVILSVTAAVTVGILALTSPKGNDLFSNIVIRVSFNLNFHI